MLVVWFKKSVKKFLSKRVSMFFVFRINILEEKYKDGWMPTACISITVM